MVFEVQEVHKYASFLEMLETESLAKVLPGVKTIEEGVKVYRKFYSEEKERSNGVLAIRVAKSAVQPYVSADNILSGLVPMAFKILSSCTRREYETKPLHEVIATLHECINSF